MYADLGHFSRKSIKVKHLLDYVYTLNPKAATQKRQSFL
jgi:hypothetical protein